jgi:putative ABC transport system permease protein
MQVLSRLVNLWRNLFYKDRLETDLTNELRAYLELLVEEKTKAGIEPGIARREAAMELGGMEQVKEQVRDARAGSALEGMLQDFRHTVRSMKMSPGSTALAVLMLTLGIGATTLIFSVFYSVLLRPLPFSQPERLVRIWETRLQKGWQRASFTEANFWDVRARNKTFEDMAAFSAADWNMTGYGEPEHVDVGRVSAEFFRVLGVDPVRGRAFLPDEDQPSHENHVVLLQNKFWRTRFNADTGIVGRTIRLDGRPYTVIGVLPPGEPWLNDASVFVPLVYDLNASRHSFGLSVVGRLRKQVSLRMAATDLQRVCRRLAEQYPNDDAGMDVLMAPAAQWGADAKLRRALHVLLGAVGFLLLIACVNLANLLLAKSAARAREMTVRAALGASRARIVRLVLTESILLSLIGGIFGLVLAVIGLDAIKAANLTGIPRINDVSLNGWVLAFTFVAACSTGVISGLIPAVQTGGRNLATALRDGDRSQAGSWVQTRLRGLLVTAEVALSLMLLVGAGLLIRSFGQLVHVERGFQSGNRLLLSVNLPSSYQDKRVTLTVNRFLASTRSLPNVIDAAAVNTRPITGWDPGMGIVAAGTSQAASATVPWASWRFVSSDYFRTMGVPLLKGKVFSQQDEFGKPWRVVVSQALADTLWPGQNAVGRQAVLWKGQSNHIAEVIGVVANMRERGLESNPTPLVFLPYNGTGSSPVEFVVHTRAAPLSIVSAIRSRLSEIDPGLPLSNVGTLDEVVRESLGPKRFNVSLLSIFAGMALLLAMAGIYGVLAYSVARRTPEIALRVVLGASRRRIMSLIVGQGMRPILSGIVVGLAAAFVLSRFLVSMLFDVTPADPVTYAGVALLVAATATVSCLLPALRASRTDPTTALRQE